MRIEQVSDRHSVVLNTELRKAPGEELVVPVHFGDIGAPSSVRAGIWKEGCARVV